MKMWHSGDHRIFCREIVLFEVPPSSLTHTKPWSKPLKSGSKALCQQLKGLSSSWYSCLHTPVVLLQMSWVVFLYFIQKETLCTACLYLFNPISSQQKKGESLPFLFICVVEKVTADIHHSSVELVQGLKSLGRFSVPSQDFGLGLLQLLTLPLLCTQSLPPTLNLSKFLRRNLFCDFVDSFN